MSARLRLSSEELLAEARRVSGIDRIDAEASEPLSVMVRALNTESNLHAEGARAMESRLIRILANRLRMQRDFAEHPEIAEQKVTAPLFICGLGRTGSTKAQKLLATSGDFNWLCFWKVLNPSLLTGRRDEDVAPRIADADAYLYWFDTASPETKYAHFFELHDAEEESLILEHSLYSPVGLGWSPIPGYLDWLLQQDLRMQFRYLRDTLKYLQWQGLADPGKPWVLKSPLYPGLEPFLLDVFPDARLLMTHREPVKCIASALRLLELFYKPFTDAPIDPAGYVEGQAAAIEQHLRNRTSMPGMPVVDLHFDALVGDSEQAMASVYAGLGMPMSSDARRRIAGWDDHNPQHAKGVHKYALADYGLDAAYINARFGSYDAFLKESFHSRGVSRTEPVSPASDPNLIVNRT